MTTIERYEKKYSDETRLSTNFDLKIKENPGIPKYTITFQVWKYDSSCNFWQREK